MRKYLLAVLLTAVLSAGARAGVVSPAAAGAQAWVGPVAGVITAAGTERVEQMGVYSLNKLSVLETDGRLPFVSNPELLVFPLRTIQQAFGITPEKFVAMSTPEKLDLLAFAAVRAEREAVPSAEAAINATAEPVRRETAADVTEKVAAAEAVSFYLSPALAEQVAQARGAVTAYENERKELMRAFLEDLPGKIAAGAFDASNLIGRDQYGWRARDEAPEARHSSLDALYEARLKRIENGPLGPWTIEEADLLRLTLRKPYIAAEIERTAPGGVKKIGASIDRLEREADARMSDELGAGTRNRFLRGVFRGGDIKRLQEFYEDTLNYMDRDRTGRARIAAHMYRGGFLSNSGMPSWKNVVKIKRKLVKNYRLDSLMSLLIGILVFGNVVETAHLAQTAIKFSGGVLVIGGAFLLYAGYKTYLVEKFKRKSWIGPALDRFFPARSRS